MRATFGNAALVQRRQVHKMRILEYLNWPAATVGAGHSATRLSERRCEDRAAIAPRSRGPWRRSIPSAAESVRDGPDETLTVLTLSLSGAAAAILGHYQRRGESTQSDASREAQRQAVA